MNLLNMCIHANHQINLSSGEGPKFNLRCCNIITWNLILYSRWKGEGILTRFIARLRPLGEACTADTGTELFPLS